MRLQLPASTCQRQVNGAVIMDPWVFILKACTHLMQLEDQYGSPTLDEIGLFSREFARALDAKIGEEAAGELSVEVSSPVSPLPLTPARFCYIWQGSPCPQLYPMKETSKQENKGQVLLPSTLALEKHIAMHSRALELWPIASYLDASYAAPVSVRSIAV